MFLSYWPEASCFRANTSRVRNILPFPWQAPKILNLRGESTTLVILISTYQVLNFPDIKLSNLFYVIEQWNEKPSFIETKTVSSLSKKKLHIIKRRGYVTNTHTLRLDQRKSILRIDIQTIAYYPYKRRIF